MNHELVMIQNKIMRVVDSERNHKILIDNEEVNDKVEQELIEGFKHIYNAQEIIRSAELEEKCLPKQKE